MALQVLAFGDAGELIKPCVDCGLLTGNFCDALEFVSGFRCIAAERVPSGQWVEGQRTPLCTQCEKKVGCCLFCRKVASCQPEPHQ